MRSSSALSTTAVLHPHAPAPAIGLSILSYNILLPNSKDGWWVYKMYSPRHNIDISETLWNSRQALLKKKIEEAACDVVCLQEVCAESFNEDFSFMAEIGYDQCELYKKGRFRPATFWRSDRVKILSPPLHRDRCLISLFQHLETKSTPSRPVYIVNCHLQAGDGESQCGRRLRQLHDCTETIRKEMGKMVVTAPSGVALPAMETSVGSKKSSKSKITAAGTTGPDPVAVFDEYPSTVFIGDMNINGRPERLMEGHRNSAIDEFLTTGTLPANYSEDGYIVSSKVKTHPLGPFVDAYAKLYSSSSSGSTGGSVANANANANTNIPERDYGDDHAASSPSSLPPPSMVCELLYGVLTKENSSEALATTCTISDTKDQSTESKSILSDLALDLLHKVFCRFADSTRVIFIAVNDTSSCNNSSSTSSSSASCVRANESATRPKESQQEERIMSQHGVTEWLMIINKQVGRGSEFRSAVTAMQSHVLPPPPPASASAVAFSAADGAVEVDSAHTSLEVDPEAAAITGTRNSTAVLPTAGYLTWQDFAHIYECEVQAGKVWGVAHDLAACGFPLPSSSNTTTTTTTTSSSSSSSPPPPLLSRRSDCFTARYDRAYVSANTTILAVRDTGGHAVACLPNREHPSDHLPLMLVIEP